MRLCLFLSAAAEQKKRAKSPEATMEAFYQLIVYQDTGAIVKLGIDQKEAQETLDEYQSSMISAIQNQFKNAGISISKSESSDILDVITDSFQKLDYKVSLKKRDGKEASVTVSSQYIHYLDLFQQAADETINELKPKHIENLSDAKKLLIENIKTSFQNAEISKDMHSKTFDLKNKRLKAENILYVSSFRKMQKRPDQNLWNLFQTNKKVFSSPSSKTGSGCCFFRYLYLWLTAVSDSFLLHCILPLHCAPTYGTYLQFPCI